MSDLPTTERPGRKPPKVSIIGTGMVGSSLAYSLIVQGTAGDLVLVDVNKDRAEGEAMDLRHAMPFGAPTDVVAGGYEECRDSDVIVITAGMAQAPGETRLDLVGKNVKIFKDIVPRLLDVAADAIILIVSNPVDVLTYVTMKISGLPWRQVVGSGTVLDSGRFRYELSAVCKVDPRNVHTYIIGEHGDSEVPVWSQTKVAGMEFPRFCRESGIDCSQDTLDAIFDRVRNAAYEIIRLKGSTYWAIALGATQMIQAILRDQHTIVTASTLLQGQYGIQDVCLSLPVVLDRGGVNRIIELPIMELERQAFAKSAQVLRETIKAVGF
ncbi:MAG: L-lactate dehydrogenase [Phycisphaerae bacterium]|nr:L-lactate dehydrogenase [Phycisphaerae bacterium]